MATAEPPAQDAAAKDEDPYRTKFSELRKELLDKLNRIKPGNGRTLRLYEKGEGVYQIVVNKIDGKKRNRRRRRRILEAGKSWTYGSRHDTNSAYDI